MNYRDKLISYNGKSSPDTILDYYQEVYKIYLLTFSWIYLLLTILQKYVGI